MVRSTFDRCVRCDVLIYMPAWHVTRQFCATHHWVRCVPWIYTETGHG